jgi:hypothetical protein
MGPTHGTKPDKPDFPRHDQIRHINREARDKIRIEDARKHSTFA